MKLKHTKGPWRLTEALTTIPIKAGDRTIASVRFRENDHADAVLIAAAPDLLEALSNARHRIANLSLALHNAPPFADPHDGPVLRQIDAAIKKATEV